MRTYFFVMVGNLRGRCRRCGAAAESEPPSYSVSFSTRGKEVMPLQPITPERVLDELACIAFADPRDPEALPVKIADKLRALELLYKHLGLGDGGGEEGVVIVDDVGKEEP